MKKYTAIIIGSGAAGYSAADWLHRHGVTNIAVLSECREAGTSRNAGSDKQTYYKVSLSATPSDCAGKMAETLFSGGSMHGDTALIEAANSMRCFMRLVEYGVPFPHNGYGIYPGYQTDHDTGGRATSAGPLTSKMMTECLEKKVYQNGTEILDGCRAIRILTNAAGVYGVLCIDANMKEDFGLTTIFADSVILATGAPALVYQDSVYPPSQTGATGLAIEAGAALRNFGEWQYGLASVRFRWNLSGSYQQVLPRYFSADADGTEHEFLTEYYGSAAKAADMVFLKGYEWPFDSQKTAGSSEIDLLVHRERHTFRRKVYLDFTRNAAGFRFPDLGERASEYLTRSGATCETPLERLQAMNPKSIGIYAAHGIDLTREPLEIAVCAQHNNGGIAVDTNWETSVEGLYAVGEAAGTFGLYRPGGTALNSTQVGGLRIAQSIVRKGRKAAFLPAEAAEALEKERKFIRSALGKASGTGTAFAYFGSQMSRAAAFVRRKEGMEETLAELNAFLAGFPANCGIGSEEEVSELYVLKSTLQSDAALLQTILASMPVTGSRGGALYYENGKQRPENLAYRTCCVMTEQGNIRFEPVRPIPESEEWFETVWKHFEEGSLC